MTKIVHRYTKEILFESESEEIRETYMMAIEKGVRLTRADLSFADLSLADLSGADFSDNNLERADFCFTDLSYADFRKADLNEVNFNDANLERTDLSDANLWGAHFSGANLNAADLRNTDLRYAVLGDANLIRIKLGYVAKVDRHRDARVAIEVHIGNLDPGRNRNQRCSCCRGLLVLSRGGQPQHHEE